MKGKKVTQYTKRHRHTGSQVETQRQAGRHSERHRDTVREMLLKLKALCQRRHAESCTVRQGQTIGDIHTQRQEQRE